MYCLRLSRLLQKPNIFQVLPKYGLHNHPIRFMETENRWQQKDGVSRQWQLIYKAPMEKWLKCLSVYLTMSTGIIGSAGIYYAIFVFDSTKLNIPVVLGEDVVIANSGFEYLIYLSAFLIFHISVKVLLSKYAIRLYQNGDNYIAVFRGHMYNSIRKHEFQLQEFKKLKPSMIITWSDARFALGKKQAIILDSYFKTPEHFNYLLHKKKADNLDND